MKRISLLLALAAALVICAPAKSATRHDNWPLHPGSSGTRVAALQWMLSGHRPNVFTKVKPTLRHYTAGVYGARTKAAVVAYRYRIGAPGWKTAEVGPYFFAILQGKVNRPASWVANAAHRVKAVVPGATPLALRIKALEVSQLGVTEHPYGSNCGAQVRVYQSVTGAYCAAWCVSFTQWAFVHGGYGTFADRTAGVFYAVGWAQRRGYLNAKPKVGAIVAFMDGQGHMGYVVKVTAGGFVSIEGNASNRVLERFHTLGDRRPVFLYLPHVA